MNVATTATGLRPVRLRRLALASVRTLAYGYLAIVAALFAGQRVLLFRADTSHVTPAEVGLAGTREEIIRTPDGERLVAWWTPPKAGKPVVLDFQGQSGEPSWRAGTMRYFIDGGFGLLSLAYRGYGASTGSPSEAALVADGKLAYDWLRRRGFEAQRIVVFGESLGTGVAVQVAAERDVAGVILDSAYTSIADVARGRFPFVPVDLLMSDTFDSAANIGRVKAPLLMVHGDKDAVVPYALGRSLYDAASEPKRFATIPGGGHTVHFSQGPWHAIKPFLDEVAALPARPAQKGGQHSSIDVRGDHAIR